MSGLSGFFHPLSHLISHSPSQPVVGLSFHFFLGEKWKWKEKPLGFRFSDSFHGSRGMERRGQETWSAGSHYFQLRLFCPAMKVCQPARLTARRLTSQFVTFSSFQSGFVTTACLLTVLAIWRLTGRLICLTQQFQDLFYDDSLPAYQTGYLTVCQ